MMSRIGDLAAQFETLIRMKTNAEKSLQGFKDQKNWIEEQLINMMAEEGMQSMTTASGMNLHRKTEKIVAVADGFTKAELLQELAQHEQTLDLVQPKFNAGLLRARLNEIEANKEQVPSEISRMIRIIEIFKIGYRS